MAVKQLSYVWQTVLQLLNTLSTLIAFTAVLFFLSCVLIKFYCDVITRSHLQLINTSIDTFFSKLGVVLVEEEQLRPMMVKRKLDGSVDESSADQEICKSEATVYKL